MKRNALALSVAAAVGAFGFAGVAMAGVISPAGDMVTPPPPSTVPAAASTVTATDLVRNNNSTGHILISPYFSTQSGNITTLHIANTDLVNGKAVKVRFRSAANSDDVFDFQILMSPGDVWTGGVTMDEATSEHYAMQFVEQRAWIPAYDIQYHLGVDGLSVPLIVLTTLVGALVLVGAWGVCSSKQYKIMHKRH